MTASRLDPTPSQVDQHTLLPARTLTVEDTPTHWTLAAVVAWILDRDLSAVLKLCEPLPADEIARGARRLGRSKVLRALASRTLGIATSTTPSPVQPKVRERLLRRLLRQQPEDEELIAVFSSNRKTRERGERLRPEDEKIATTIAAAIRELFAALAEKKLTAEDDHSEAIPPRQFYRIRSFRHLLESRVGPHYDVRIARTEVLQWAEDKPNQGGRPPLPYKKEVIEKTLAWLDEEGEQTQAETIRFMRGIVSEIDDQGGPCNATLRTWAKDILDKFRRQRSEIVETSTG